MIQTTHTFATAEPWRRHTIGRSVPVSSASPRTGQERTQTPSQTLSTHRKARGGEGGWGVGLNDYIDRKRK